MRDSAVATNRILIPGRNCWAVSPQTSGGLLIDGRDYFRSFYRAASKAKRFILLAGWQFDVNVSLLRGEDLAEAWGDPRLLPFLTALVRRTPELEIRILCWDYSPAYFFQREWFQDYRFNWSAPPRLQFRFDDRHAFGASHHQKFIVIDGALGFLGSMDLCNERWDQRRHPARCDGRLEPYGEEHYDPNHEVQAAFTGPIVGDLVELFRARWRSSGGGDLVLSPPTRRWEAPLRCSIRIAAREAGLSRTVAQTLVPDQPSIREIRQLYVDAISSADRSIYIENQYFGSTAIYEAILRRLLAEGRPPLHIVMIYPPKLHSFTEELSMGPTQSRMFRRLTDAAAQAGHRMGVYYSCSAHEDGREAGRYVHSKLMIVDDRFLTVGSANTNNRSMGLDTELNVSWEADEGEDDLRGSIRRARVSLLAEHAGLVKHSDIRALFDDGSMVETLDRFCEKKTGGLRRHSMSSGVEALPQFDLDPERPVLEEDVFERVSPSHREWVTGGMRRLRRRVLKVGRRRRIFLAVNSPSFLSRRPLAAWHALSRWSRRLLVPILALGAAAGLVWILILVVRALLHLFR